jgi:hypothetical protein
MDQFPNLLNPLYPFIEGVLWIWATIAWTTMAMLTWWLMFLLFRDE